MITIADILNALATLQVELDTPAVSGRLLAMELGIRSASGSEALYRVLARLIDAGRVAWDGERLYPSYRIIVHPSAAADVSAGA